MNNHTKLVDEESVLSQEDEEHTAPAPKRNVGEYMWTIFLILCGVLVASNFVYQLSRWDKHFWFKSDLTSPDNVRNWSQDYMDEHLHELSRWDGVNKTEWLDLVKHAYSPLNISQNEQFRFLEIGVGVGAWARILLRDFPNASGAGFDVDPDVVAIARVVLPEERFDLKVTNFINTAAVYQDQQFDYVFISGTLCYADNLWQAYDLLHTMVKYNVVRRGGYIVATIVPSETSELGSCVTRIPLAFWHSQNDFEVLALQQMDDWHLPHAMGRYAVFLKAK